MDASTAAAHVGDLYDEHHAMVREYLSRMCRNRHLAEDLTSETFERALRALVKDGAVAHQNPIAWLRAIARNLLTDHYRKAAIRREITTATVDDPEPQAAADVPVLASEALVATHALLERLTPGQRDVMILSTLNGFTTQETAVLMGRTPQAIRSLRHKAVRRLLDIHARTEAAEATA